MVSGYGPSNRNQMLVEAMRAKHGQESAVNPYGNMMSAEGMQAADQATKDRITSKYPRAKQVDETGMRGAKFGSNFGWIGAIVGAVVGGVGGYFLGAEDKTPEWEK